jgi:predicted amidohydrolase YtcJ
VINRKLVVADAVRTPEGLAGNALLVENGRVAAIGNRPDLVDSSVTEERYPGAVVVPGLRDAHFHPVAYTAAISGTSLKTAADFDDIADRLRRASQGGSGRPIIAIRLDDESLAEGRLPTRQDLDAAISNRPVLIHRYCGHVAVANTAALRTAGISSDTRDPEGGVIDRDEAGEPTGVLRETAIDPVSAQLAAAVRIEPGRLNEALRGLAGMGITSIGAMTRTGDGPWATLGNEAEILAKAGPELPIRARSYLIAGSIEELRSHAAALSGAGTNLTWAGLKRFGDGSFGGHTAAMHEPFTDQPDERGTLRLTETDESLARACLDMGGSIAIHAIGDLACTRVIDLFETFVDEGIAGHRLRLEHASVLTSSDVGRLARLGIIASVQPAFMASETGWLEKRLGPERLLRTYPLATLESAGVALAGGSDCPVEPPNPWAGIALARDRAGIVPEEGLSPESAFRLFTSGGARALGEPIPLSDGSPADFLVVDRDPVAATPDEVRQTEVIGTWIDGELVAVDRSAITWAE